MTLYCRFIDEYVSKRLKNWSMFDDRNLAAYFLIDHLYIMLTLQGATNPFSFCPACIVNEIWQWAVTT